MRATDISCATPTMRAGRRLVGIPGYPSESERILADPEAIARFYDRCSDLMRALLDGLSHAPDTPRPFPEVEDAIGWPHRRIASVLGGVSRLRHREFGGARPYHFLAPRHALSRRWEIWMDARQCLAIRDAARTDVADLADSVAHAPPTRISGARAGR